MCRDEEIKRLVLYMKACGVRVRIHNYNIDEAGSFEECTKTVNINKRYHRSKTEIVLTLLHEASHVKYSALYPEMDYDGMETDEDGEYLSTKKSVRDKALKFEIESYQLIPDLCKELDIQLSEKKIKSAIEFDTWTYQEWAKEGEWPNRKQTRQKLKQLREKYKK